MNDEATACSHDELTCRLAEELRRPVEASLARSPAGAGNILIVLNALAIVAATVLAGTDGDPRAIKFFMTALNDNFALCIGHGLGDAPPPEAPLQ